MIEFSFNTLAGISIAARPALYLPAGALTPDSVIPFYTRRRQFSLADRMAADMLAEIDRDIIRALQAAAPSPAQLLNEALFAQLSSRDPVLEQEAIDRVNDFTRMRMREDGFYRRIMPPIPISNDELDRSIETNLPVRVVDRNPLRDRLLNDDGTRRPNAAARRAARRRLRFAVAAG